MSTEVKVPSMGESITTGILAAWHVADGDYVEKEQSLYELETDKITQEATAECAGVIRLKAAEGDEVEIGQAVAIIDESAAKPDSADTGEPQAAKPATQADTATTQTSQAAATGQTAQSDAQSPAVRRIATESGVDPATVQGSGKGGRVTKGDMLAAIEARPAKAAAAPANAPTTAPQSSSSALVAGGERTTRKKMTPLRKRIAERLVEAQSNAAILTTFNEVDMSTVMQTRKQYQDDFVKKYGIKLGFMSFFVKAAVKALQEVPAVNAQIEGDTIIQNHFYDIGVAVGTDKGLMVPVVRDCDQKDFAQIETDIVDYAKAARDGKIKIDDLQGGVFTISNGGIYGSMLSTPILNPPQSGILGLHNITERAVVVNGEITIRPMMYLALTYDHRLVDGKEAVTFLVKIKQAIEDPSRLLFGI